MTRTLPQRIQRKRTQGWRMPRGVIYVGRPTVYGNPFVIGGWYMKGDPDPQRFIRFIYTKAREGYQDERYTQLHSAAECVGWFRWYVETLGPESSYIERIKKLRGRDLACWCPLVDENGERFPCHADVLLEVANCG